jgi:sodium/proline symporter
MLLSSFIFFMLLFAVIGCMAVTKAKKNTKDYLIADRSLPGWLVGLSAVATNNSGFMFIGMIGYTYSSGFITVWFMVGWILGDYLGLSTILRPVVSASRSSDSRSLGGLLSNWLGKSPYRNYGKISGILTVLFLTVYAAAQFKAGSKSLDAIFGIDKTLTVTISAGLVLLYCFSGGIRASIWTDAAQSVVMFIAMILLAVIGFFNYEGSSGLVLPEKYFSIVPGIKEVLLTVLGAIGGGFMVSGQPHIISRFLTLKSVDESKSLIRCYYFWFIAFYILTVIVGMYCRLLLDPSIEFDAEMALPRMAMQFLPDVGVGLILAAIFAATISTADSLILACTAAVVEEFNNKHEESFKLTKAITVIILIFSIIIAMMNNDTIFSLVLDAWAMLGVSFCPLLFLRCFGRQFSERRAVLSSLGGLALFIIINRAKYIFPEGWLPDSAMLMNTYYLTPLFVIILIVIFNLNKETTDESN